MQYYNSILVFHIMSVLSWMAMLFYLPRLYVYHQEHSDNKGFIEVVKIQEYKLYKYIGVPALWATVLSGLLMAYLNSGLFDSGIWLYLKISLVGVLIAYSYSLGYFRKKLFEDRCTKSGKFFRFYNEVPTIISLFIVIFVVSKPF